MEEALIEWRDARQAIFDTPVDAKTSPAMWTRLGHAEHRLMELARKLARVDGIEPPITDSKSAALPLG